MLLSEREVRELVGVRRNEPTFPRPHQYGPLGLKWLDSDVKKWMEKRTPKKKLRRPKGEGEAVETRPVE